MNSRQWQSSEAIREQQYNADRIQKKTTQDDIGILLTAVKRCGKSRDCAALIKLHFEATASGLDSNIYVANSFIDMFAKCGRLAEARKVFDGISRHTVVSWNALILGYAENGIPKAALELFVRMQSLGFVPCRATFLAVLKACVGLAADEDPRKVDGKLIKIKSLEIGMAIHRKAEEQRCDSQLLVANTLVDMYAKCGSLVDARRVFERMSYHTVVSWTALILGFAENGEGEQALEMLHRMQLEGCLPNGRTVLALLKACNSLAGKEEAKLINEKLLKVKLLEKAMAVHSQALETVDRNIFLANTLLDLYARCGSLEDACKLLDKIQVRDVVTYNVMMLGFSQSGQSEVALQLFVEMMRSECCLPNSQSFVAALKACSNLTAKERGRVVEGGRVVKTISLENCMAIHSLAAETGKLSEGRVIHIENSLLDIYSKSGSLIDAQRVFDSMKRRDVVSWTSLVLGYFNNGEIDEGLQLFARMQQEGYEPDAPTYVVVLNACGSAAFLQAGRAIQGEIYRRGMEEGCSSLVINNCLIDLYGKCGDMTTSQLIFDSAAEADIVGWNALITGYSRLSDTDSVLRAVESLQDQSDAVKADGVTLLCVLASCSHAGLVEKGRSCFEEMTKRFGIVPEIEHYHCVIDMLGRSNQVEAALEFVKGMPYEADAVTWSTVLGACSKHKNVGVGRTAFQESMVVSWDRSSEYALMANVYN